MSNSQVQFTPEQLAAMNLAAMSPEQLAAIFGGVAASAAPKQNGPTKVRNITPRGPLAKQMKALDEWVSAQDNGAIKAEHLPLGHRGLRIRKGSKITRVEQTAAKHLRLKLNVAFGTQTECVLTQPERAAVNKWASVSGLTVSGFEKGKPWNLAQRVKADGTPDMRAGLFFREGGTVSIDRQNVVTFKHGRKKIFAQMQANAAEAIGS